MNPDYIFSYYSSHQVPVLKRRPWWNLWGKDRIVMEDAWARHNFHGIPKDEADLIINASRGRWQTPGGRLIVRLIGPVSQVQLEESWYKKQAGTAGHYVSTPTPADCEATGDFDVSVRFAQSACRVRNELHGEPT